DCNSTADQPCAEWILRLNGTLFTAANGYDGPGVGVGNDVYSIGTYMSWTWASGGLAAMNQHTDAWATWMSQNAPGTEYFLYLEDEPPAADYPQVETWAKTILSNTGPGNQVRSFVTLPLTTAAGTPTQPA